MDLANAYDTISRTPLWTTLYMKGIPTERTNHIRHGRQGTKLAPEYKGKYREPWGRNIGVFRGSAISAILFIIYMDDMMEDNAALNRRSNLPARIVHDRPAQKAKQLLWETIAAKDKINAPPQGQQIARKIKICRTKRETEQHGDIAKKRKRRKNKRMEKEAVKQKWEMRRKRKGDSKQPQETGPGNPTQKRRMG